MKQLIRLIPILLALCSLGVARQLISRRGDLLGSSSSVGYAYEQRHGQPVSYVHYSSQLEDAYPVYERQAVAPGVQPLAPYYDIYAARQGHPLPPPPPPQVYYHHHVASPGSYEEEDDDDDDESASSSSSSGSEQTLEDSSSSAERGHKGYANRHGFEAAKAEHHDKGQQEANYEDKAGHAAGHEDSADERAAHEHKEAARKGGSHSAGSSHKKGERTTGYHKVYHKDEYKKDSEFYDEAHKAGHYEKYGSNDAQHAAEEAGHVKKGHHEQAHREGHSGKHGYKEKGHVEQDRRGHEAEQAEDVYSREKEGHASRANKAHRAHLLEHR